jgi:hypothetical protein
MPDGLLEAARADLRLIYDALNKELAERQLRFGIVSRWWRARMKPSRRLAICANSSKRKTCYFPTIENGKCGKFHQG